MFNVVLVISRCQAMRYSPKTQKKYYRFHFKGFYTGVKIKEIRLNAEENLSIIKGEDYLLWVEPSGIKESILIVNLIKYKKLE